MKSLVAVSTVLVAATAVAEVSVSALFSDHMVLQRDREVPVWGKASPGEPVAVRFAGREVRVTATSDGEWEARLPPNGWTTTPQELRVKGETGECCFRDVLIGDVWLVSGQSNAEYNFGRGVVGGEKAKQESAKYPNIRAVKFNHERSVWPERVVGCAEWKVADAKSLDGITAEGYFMARELNAKTGIPIGILDNNWGGCRIDAYLSLDALAAEPELAGLHRKAAEQANWLKSKWWRDKVVKAQDEYVAWVESLKRGRSTAGEVGFLPSIWHQFNTELCGQYNAMIAPLLRFPIAGATWYQGCSNEKDGDCLYYHKLMALVSCWRKGWGYEFPFYIVQLASYTDKTDDPAGGNGFAGVRNAQLKASKALARSGLAVAIDVGNAKDIHPKNKYDIGYRLSLWARRDVYGEKGLVVSGPLFKGIKVEEGRVRVKFDYVGSGLVVGVRDADVPGMKPTAPADGRLHGFAVAGEDKKWQWADARIDGNDVVVSSALVRKPVAVRYAYRANPMGESTLYNREGLPAAPFRSDDW